MDGFQHPDGFQLLTVIQKAVSNGGMVSNGWWFEAAGCFPEAG
jgi:hypothetical protein